MYHPIYHDYWKEKCNVKEREAKGKQLKRENVTRIPHRTDPAVDEERAEVLSGRWINC